MTPEESLALVLSKLDQFDIPYMITGSFASNVHSLPRATYDADVVIELAPKSLEKLLEIAAGKFPIMGNVPTTLFSSGTPEEMESAVRHCIDTAAEGSGYILASGCEIPLDSTEDRVAHFFEYAHQYGREFMMKLKESEPERFSD